MALTDNLKAYYKLNQGELLVDSSGNGYTLTNTGSVAESSDGKFNYCADYGTSGTTKVLERSDVVGLTAGGSWSVNMWVKYNSLPANGTQQNHFTIESNGDAKKFCQFDYRNESGTRKYNVWTGSGGGNESKYTIEESTGVYYMFTFCYNSSTGNLLLYRNNSLIITQATYSSPPSSTGIWIGNTSSDNRQVFAKIDEVGIWDRLLSADERAELYNSGSGYEIPLVTTSIKSINGLAYSSVKSYNGLAKASIKSINGLT